MMDMACNCGWDIPGVKSLPWHYHYKESRVRRLSDGYVFTLKSVFVEQEGYEIASVEECIRFSVSYKDLLRVLSANRDSALVKAAGLKSMVKE